MYPGIPWEHVVDIFGPKEHAFGTTELDECVLFPHTLFFLKPILMLCSQLFVGQVSRFNSSIEISGLKYCMHFLSPVGLQVPHAPLSLSDLMYVVGSKSFRPNQLFKVTEIKQLCYFSIQSPFISTHTDRDTLTSLYVALYILRSIFHLARLLYVRPETFEPYHVPLMCGENSELRSSLYWRIFFALVYFLYQVHMPPQCILLKHSMLDFPQDTDLILFSCGAAAQRGPWPSNS